MDLITIFPRTHKKHDSIMVVADRLTKVADFIPRKSMYSTSVVAQVFVIDVVRLHDVLLKIVSDRDANLTLSFSKELFAVWAYSLPLAQLIIHR